MHACLIIIHASTTKKNKKKNEMEAGNQNKKKLRVWTYKKEERVESWLESCLFLLVSSCIGLFFIVLSVFYYLVY